ncbi:hypothetical protein NA57DRAFT_46353 [Rhizodiscina lignyota]|uniref:Zn(2)-C6 fungal-type domain-containing protein n=1 Tax=Rhizodiscina lignyota TaxID=1504668 RepID=A0A9P4I8M4_9PEZI|nr:hypothetical protein NA57DRAFT_46353 [Rhizodiscina lignyota]
MPFPSTGCEPCRTRRVKCDETQPVCKRCARTCTACYGARQAFSMVHTENPYASGRKKRPRGPRSTKEVGLATKLDCILTRSPFDLQTEAVAFYVHYYLQGKGDAPPLVQSAMDDVELTLSSKAPCQVLYLAVSTLALAVFSRVRQHPQAASEASIKYQQLLQALQVRLRALDQNNIDTCLLANFFMSMYEDSLHRPDPTTKTATSRTLRSLPHQEGALAILKFWRDHLSTKQPATKVIKHTRRSAIKRALVGNFALPEWIVDGASFGEQGLELEYDSILARISNARHALSRIIKQMNNLQPASTDQASTLKILYSETQDIDRALQDWKIRFPSAWSARRHTLPGSQSSSTEFFYSSSIHSHESPACAAVWLRYYSSRMLVNSTCLTILELLEPDTGGITEDQFLEYLSCIKEMSDGLASTIPFSLERFAIINNIVVVGMTENTKPSLGTLAINPLSIASSIRHVDMEHKLWFKSQLARIGRETGYGLFESAMTNEWLDF